MLIAATVLDHVAQFLNLLGKATDLPLHVFQAWRRHGRSERTVHLRLGGSAVRTFLRPLNLLPHLARHLLQALGRFVEACGAEVLDGFREMSEAGAGVAMSVGVMAVAALRRTLLLTMRRRPG
jgi:hypothetical protein